MFTLSDGKATDKSPLPLSSRHLADLRASGINDDTIRAAGLYTVEGPRVYEILNWTLRSDGSGLGGCLAFPFLTLDGNRTGLTRLKPNSPRKRGNKPVKYESPRGSKNLPYFPPLPALQAAVGDPAQFLLFTEGEKKCLKSTQEGFPTIGLVGVQGWSKKRLRDADGNPIGPRELRDELAAIGWQGRLVYICYDSDAVTNDDVLRAEFSLAQALLSKQALVKIVRLPPGDAGAKVGLDDFLLAHGPDEFRKLLTLATDARLPDESLPQAHRTDLGNSRRVISAHGHDLRYCFAWKTWLAWDGRRWAQDETGEAVRRVKETQAALYHQAAAALNALPSGADTQDQKRAWDLFKHAVKWESATAINHSLELARSEPVVPILPDALDSDPFLLNVLNGTLNLRTGQLQPHARADLITKLCLVSFDPDAACPLWLSCLQTWMDGNEKLTRYLQRVVGYGLTGDVREHALWFFYGKGRNGKSTFLGTIMSLLGSYAMQAAPELLLTKKHEAHPTERADLRGRRFVATIEVEEGRHLAEKIVKQLTGGDPIRARFLFKDFFEFLPSHKIVLAANHRPQVSGNDVGIWSRIKLVPWTITIPEERRDKTLPDKLKQELPGILCWALLGCLDWQRDGLAEPDVVRQATSEYRSQMDDVQAFVQEVCKVHESLRVQVAALVTAYQNWSGMKTVTRQWLSQRLQEKGFLSKEGTGGRCYYHGIGLSPPDQEWPE
jgi:putative DNA primase/helicase